MPESAKPNLKLILMNLGNKLVTEHRFLPAAHKGYGIPSNFYDPATRATHLIAELTEFINSHDEARQVLAELGVEWPISKQQQKQADDLLTRRIANESHDDGGKRTVEAVEVAIMGREKENRVWASNYVYALSTQGFVTVLKQAYKQKRGTRK